MPPPASIIKPPHSRRQKACETCRRRKERCDGLQPCGRCCTRKVASECRRRPSVYPPQLPQNNDLVLPEAHLDIDENDVPTATYESELVGTQPAPIPQLHSPSPTISRHLSASLPLENPMGSTVSLTSCLVRDRQGAYMFLGPSANLSMLQCIRKVVYSALGPCQFTEEPPQNDLVDEDPDITVNWDTASVEPQRPSVADARYYLEWYTSATSCVFDLFGYEELTAEIISWLGRAASVDASTCINFLVLAIGAQCGPEDRDSQADAYFTYARYLASTRFLEVTKVSTIQIYSLIAMYLLNATRPNAAIMHLGVAIRTAHSLGIHRPDISTLFSAEENSHRERIWKVLRVLDLFLSIYLGQQPSTTETRDAMSQQEYSASADLCCIFEKILGGIYNQQEVSPTVLEHVSQHHREWASHFREGLRVDRISTEEHQDGDRTPNIGLCHLKEAYYWSIILATRPYLIELVRKHIARDTNTLSSSGENAFASPKQEPDTLLAHASVNSAVLTINLLEGFLREDGIPKRLPYIINSILNAALVLGTGYFADLDHLFPLNHAMGLAEKLLNRFQFNDTMARWSLRIVRDLRNVCEEHVKRRRDRRLDRQRVLAESLFGDIKACYSEPWPLHSSQLSLQSLPSGEHACSEGGDFGLQFSGFDGDLRLEENSVIWSQLFDSEPSDAVFGAEFGAGEPAFAWA
ncbi:uncharacterized protein N7515_001550 [Penicillium bovifimosum]|uniref:Zn(2)-C6 fungal-type domain-containing protein n=1 Tax=Penicillium bovifimosum TaxID=126998 RepID=A0A9W9HBT3_9EURO|nr:uncharacterized protein N7515_001550 [Penicillium bovifimosum]KAJ5142763.1 hypothetical protein N7515_001550 [Penicillium bovifimosum]